MKAILVRIGIDQAYGGWNAPVDPSTWEYAYVPIPEGQGTKCHRGLERHYAECVGPVCRFGVVQLPTALADRMMHLDPDFETLTYGDNGRRRGAGLTTMGRGDMLVFYAGLKPIQPCGHRLVYALVGLYVVEEVVWARDVPRARWGENAHTRKSTLGDMDIVVRARPGRSGRFERCIPIGEWRDGAYRVRRDVLKEWGGLSVKDGFIQRSAVPPEFSDPERFRRWFDKQKVALLQRNF